MEIREGQIYFSPRYNEVILIVRSFPEGNFWIDSILGEDVETSKVIDTYFTFIGEL